MKAEYKIRHKDTQLFYRSYSTKHKLEPSLTSEGDKYNSLNDVKAAAKSILCYIHPEDIEGMEGGYLSALARSQLLSWVKDFNNHFEIVKFKIIEDKVIKL